MHPLKVYEGYFDLVVVFYEIPGNVKTLKMLSVSIWLPFNK